MRSPPPRAAERNSETTAASGVGRGGQYMVGYPTA